MGEIVSYRSRLTDSDRWLRFEHRPGDIVICSPPKSGTTWTQMICALMIFDGPEFPDKLDGLSPWLDQLIRSEDEVFGIYDGQRHRRFVKTHTPLDGIPMRDDVHYLVVGRDPRDVAVSFEHHMANLDLERAMRSRVDAVGPVEADLPARHPGADPDPVRRFEAFVDAAWEPSSTATSLCNIVHHLRCGWERRDRPNVGMFHFLDYQRDLVGEMVRIAELCDLDHSPLRLAELAPEAGIERMRERADEVTPDVAASDHWYDRTRFFRSGRTGQWHDRVDEALLGRYHTRVDELTNDPDFARWIHDGARGPA